METYIVKFEGNIVGTATDVSFINTKENCIKLKVNKLILDNNFLDKNWLNPAPNGQKMPFDLELENEFFKNCWLVSYAKAVSEQDTILITDVHIEAETIALRM